MAGRGCYLPRKYRSPNTFTGLLVFELPLTIALLALFGIAAPDLYRTRLWQDGADSGFNSSPERKLYELANYRPYETPMVWSQFITNFNLVISVLSMFFLLVKAPMFILNVFYPPMSVVVHTALIIVYAISAVYQAGKDMSDPDHPQSGPPWYITKDCDVANIPSNIGYCKQAKSAFACTIVVLAIFAAHFVLAIISCLPTEETRAKQRERLERRRTLEELKSLKSPTYPTNGGVPLMTPRTTAFHQLGGTQDLPLRSQADNGSVHSSPDLRDKDVAEGLPAEQHQERPQSQPHPQPRQTQQVQQIQQPQPVMYFPPPPKKASKK